MDGKVEKRRSKQIFSVREIASLFCFPLSPKSPSKKKGEKRKFYGSVVFSFGENPIIRGERRGEATIKSHPALAMATISRILVKVPKKPREGAPQFPGKKEREKSPPRFTTFAIILFPLPSAVNGNFLLLPLLPPSPPSGDASRIYCITQKNPLSASMRHAAVRIRASRNKQESPKSKETVRIHVHTLPHAVHTPRFPLSAKGNKRKCVFRLFPPLSFPSLLPSSLHKRDMNKRPSPPHPTQWHIFAYSPLASVSLRV